MAFNRPTLEQLVDRVQSDIETRMGIVGASLRNSFTKLFGKVIAGVAHLLHGHLAYNAQQLFPDTAESSSLARWASIWGITRVAAEFASGEITITGTDGVFIPSGTEFVSSDGVTFVTTEDATISGSTVVVGIRASSAGADGNAALGTVLTFSSPIVGAETEATVTSEIAGGADEESDDSLRARLLDRIQNPPLGGTKADYETWANEVAGVTRAWAVPRLLGEGTVGIYIVNDDDEEDIIPPDSTVKAVSAYIETKKPVTASHYVFAPTAEVIDFDITVSPLTPAVTAAIQGELQDLFAREADPVGGTIYLSRVSEAISIADGEIYHVLNSPTADIQETTGYIPTLGTITWR